MRFTISRSSDDFRSVELPDPSVRPHPRAIWDEDIDNWVISLLSLEHVVDLASAEEDVVIRKVQYDLAHIEIDDVKL